MEKITIKRATADDAKEMLALFKIIGSETDNLTFDENGIPYSEEEESKLLKEKESLTSEAMFVARIDNEIVGTAHYTACSGKRMCHRGRIGICIRKSAWGKGIGTMLMNTLLDFAKNTALSDIAYLEVRSDNERAIQLYKKMGFEKIGCFKGFFKIDGKLIDFDIMEKFL